VNWASALLLGILQGLTEFLPVSSSGHLALVQIVLDRAGAGIDQPGVLFDALLHVGTAMAVVFSERKEIRRWLNGDWRFLGFLVVGTLATGLFAFPLRHVATEGFSNLVLIGSCLLLTGVLVLSTRWFSGGDAGEKTMSLRQVLVVGLFQGLAVFPGLSRSGTTIAVGLGAGLERNWAARFSFLLSVPVILGATLVELISHRGEVWVEASSFWMCGMLGAVCAGITGYFALRLVIRSLGSHVFHRFAWYCVPLGALVLMWGLMG